jgi:ribonuclease HI
MGQEFVWSLVYGLWKQKTGVGLAKPLVGDIMACGLIKKGNTRGKTDAGRTRLYKIVISESAHLIWRLKNEQVIDGKDTPTSTEIRNRWEHCLISGSPSLAC